MNLYLVGDAPPGDVLRAKAFDRARVRGVIGHRGQEVVRRLHRVLAIVFLSWFAWIFYALLAPIKPRPDYRSYRSYRYDYD